MGTRLKKILLILVSAICAYYIGFYLIPLDAEKSRETIEVLRFNRDISMNQEIKESYLEVIEVGSYNFPKTVVDSKEVVAGSYALQDIAKGQFVFPQLYQNSSIPSTSFLYEDPEYDGISINVDNEKCVGGVPKPGDRVRLMVYREGKEHKELGEVLMDDDLDDLEVLDLLNKEGESLDKVDEDSISNGRNKIPSTIILKANKKQLKKIVESINTGEIHLSLRPVNYSEYVDVDNESVKLQEANTQGETYDIETDIGGFSIDD